MAEFKVNIKEIRKQRKLTQVQMAELLSTSYRAYQHYEAGTREPNIKTLKKIADTLDVTTDYLVGRDPKKEGK